MSKVDAVLNSFTKIDEDFLEELEETLIMSDVGVSTASDICEKLQGENQRRPGPPTHRRSRGF